MAQLDRAPDVAARLLAQPLPRRLAHSRAVGRGCTAVAERLGLEVDQLTAAGWLHDVGYAPDVAQTGFHPLDGARYLRTIGLGGPALWSLVAHHTGAVVEARHRGLLDVLLEEFPAPTAENELPLRALTFCDLSTSPDGAEIDPEDRIDEILTRYPPGDVVHDSVTEARDGLLSLCHDVRVLLDTGGTANSRPHER